MAWPKSENPKPKKKVSKKIRKKKRWLGVRVTIRAVSIRYIN